MSNSIINKLRQRFGYTFNASLTSIAKLELQKDSLGLANMDPGIEKIVQEGIDWICRAQQNSKERDGGVARHFSLLTGWGSSYPETSGYIVPTLLEHHKSTRCEKAKLTAIEILDWLVGIQFPDGGFQGGTMDAAKRVPVTFNTGQILIGLSAAVEHGLGDKYYEPMLRAANWLRDSQDSDGAWRKHPTPFAAAGDKVYETHVAWGLLEAERQATGNGYAETALRNINWALSRQQSNGWFADCCLNRPETPLTHTIGYTVRGVLEAWRFNEDPILLDHACITLDSLLSCIDSEGRLPGRLNYKWEASVEWVCLTGSSQLAHCFLMAYEHNKRKDYLEAAIILNRFVRKTISIDGEDNVRGAVKGSFPVDGDYGKFEYLNWAAKFTIDSNLLEQRLTSGTNG